MTYNPATKTLTWSGSYSDRTGSVTGAHIHAPAEVSKNGPGLLCLAEKRYQGDLFTKPFRSPFQGLATLTDEQAKHLMGGLNYVNIHSAAHLGREIRGQLLKSQ